MYNGLKFKAGTFLRTFWGSIRVPARFRDVLCGAGFYLSWFGVHGVAVVPGEPPSVTASTLPFSRTPLQCLP